MLPEQTRSRTSLPSLNSSCATGFSAFDSSHQYTAHSSCQPTRLLKVTLHLPRLPFFPNCNAIRWAGIKAEIRFKWSELTTLYHDPSHIDKLLLYTDNVNFVL